MNLCDFFPRNCINYNNLWRNSKSVQIGFKGLFLKPLRVHHLGVDKSSL